MTIDDLLDEADAVIIADVEALLTNLDLDVFTSQ